ncbi:MAG: PstS family phosphate ABC transporter substrate-binding protein [Verrucomicrobiales bacterium]
MKFTFLSATLLASLALGIPSCGKKGGGSRVEIRVKGSDTMIQLTTAWAEGYRKVKPNVYINANGGGSGTGIAAMQNGTTDICASSRDMTAEEKHKVKETTGKEAQEFAVCHDALAIYTHKANPTTEISIEELKEIWAEGGSINRWEQINPSFPGEMRMFGRQNNSGTYDYFREHICGRGPDGKPRELKHGISEMNGSAEVVENVSKTPNAIGYSGMGYKTKDVNWLKVAPKKGAPGIEPGAEAARTRSYPIARKLYFYIAGDPNSEMKAFIDWVIGPEGQKIVVNEGFVALK